MSTRKVFVLGAVLLVIAPSAWGAEPFVLTGTTTTGTPAEISASGSSLPDLVRDLIETQNDFQAFQGQGFSAGLDYGGIPDAIRFDRNAAGTSATLTIPSTGFSRTFTGSDEADVLDKVKDFLLKDGAQEYAKFLRTVNERSLLGVADGNPLAATALLANSSFFKFGLQRSPYDAGGVIHQAPDGSGLRLDLAGGFANTDDGDGFYGTVALSSIIRFTRHIGLSLSAPFTYREVEGAQVFHTGLEVALPIVLLAPAGDRGAVWQITPSFLSGASGSLDLAAGGTFLGGGLTNSIAVPFGETTTITIGNGIYFFDGYPISIGDYQWDTDVSQQIVKNGIKLTQALGRSGLFADASLTHTAFLQDAAMDTYLTPGFGVGLRFGSTSGLRVAYQGDFGDGYTAHGGSATLYFNF